MSSHLTFLSNAPGSHLLDRLQSLLGKNTRFFDSLVGYSCISRFYKLYPSLEETQRIRILIGLKTDAAVFDSLHNDQRAICKLVHRILAAKCGDPYADASKLEAKIDHLIYKLYDLNEDEIAIVENASK